MRKKGFPHDYTDLPRPTVWALNWANASVSLFGLALALALLTHFGWLT